METLNGFSQMALIVCEHPTHGKNGLIRYIVCVGRNQRPLWKDGEISWSQYSRFTKEHPWIKPRKVFAPCKMHTELS